MSRHIQVVCSIFFQKVHEIKQAYGYYDPQIVCEIIRIFGTSFYGSPLWNLSSKEHLILNRSWNATVKIIFNLPYENHTRFVESLTSVPHLKSTSFLKIQNLLFKLCKNNQLSNTSHNINYLLNEYKIFSLEELLSKKQ